MLLHPLNELFFWHHHAAAHTQYREVRLVHKRLIRFQHQRQDLRPAECGQGTGRNCQDTIFGGFAPNSQTAEVLSKALGSRTVLSGSVSRGKNDPSQSLQMMERALLTPDELKSIPKGSFIVMKTGTHPMRTRLQLFLNWGITFGEPYVVPERANRAVAYANRVDLERNLPQLSEPEEMDESRGYAVSSRGGIAHAPAQERAVKRGKQMKTFGEEER